MMMMTVKEARLTIKLPLLPLLLPLLLLLLHHHHHHHHHYYYRWTLVKPIVVNVSSKQSKGITGPLRLKHRHKQL